MPIRIRSKNSVVRDKAPLPTDLEIGELALNAHQDSPAIYLKDAAGAVRKVAGVGSVGSPDATETVKGVVELATAAETTTGTDTTRAVTPAGLKVELDKKAPLASPALTGAPTAPTAAAGTNTTQLATTAFVHDATPDATTTAKGLVQLADAAAITAGTAGRVVDAAQLNDAKDWTRTGTELSPKTAGDSVLIGGAVKVGGTTGAPNAHIKADGSAVFSHGNTQLLVGGGIYTVTNSSTAELEVLFGEAASASKYGLLAYYPTGYASATGQRQPGSVVLQSSGVGDKAVRLNAVQGGDIAFHVGAANVNPAVGWIRGATGDLELARLAGTGQRIVTANATGTLTAVPGAVCKVWVNFDGTASTPAIRASYNVSSITDNGVGDYTVNFTTPLPDANYAMTGNGGQTNGTSFYPFNIRHAYGAGSVQVNYTNQNAVALDVQIANVAIFR